MLRSIFSLIQNIIDSDKEYNNKKSNTVIYLVSNPDNTFNMDLEIDGKPRETLKSIKVSEMDNSSSTFKITTDQGDSVTCKHFTDKKIQPKSGVKKEDGKLCEEYKEMVERIGERTSFSNDEEIIGDSELKTSEDGETKVHDFLEKMPQKQVKIFQKDKDQIGALLEQIQKMKTGMERLQEIAQQFNCSDQFKQDVEFLTKNVKPALKKAKIEHKNLTPKT